MAEKIADQTCSVCLERFSEPKILPCCHTFCLKCLEKTVRDSEREEEITCPQCHKTHTIPAGGPQDFLTDFVVSHEVEVSGLTASPKAICGECEGEGPVESYCTDCQSYLCKECSNQAHKKLRPYRGHKVIPVQDLDAVSLQSSKVHYCSTHGSKVVKLYCETCRKLVCTKCYLVDHHQHSYVSVQDARKQLGDQLVSLVEDGKKKLAAFKNNLGEIQKVEVSAARYPEAVRAEINAFFDDVIQSTEKRRHQLLAQAETECHKDLKLVCADKLFHQATIPEAEDVLQFADKAKKCTSDVQMIQTALQSIRQLSQLQAIQWEASTFTSIVLSPWIFQRTELSEVGVIERASTSYSVKVENLPTTTELGKPLTFKIIPTLVDKRSQRKVCLIAKAEVLVTYGYSKKLLNTVSVSPESDGSSVVTMHPLCGGKHTIEIRYDGKPAEDKQFSLNVTGEPTKGDCVRKGPDWRDNTLHVKEGIIESLSVKPRGGTYVNVKWKNVDDVHQYHWDERKIELVL